MKKIKFVANRPWLKKDDISVPEPILRTLPKWYTQASRFLKDSNGNFLKDPQGGKFPDWKACPAIYDIMGTGYVYKTPCDMHVTEENGIPKITIDSNINKTFIQPRQPMNNFKVPEGYYDHHFAWVGQWGVELPKGYSAIYIHPANRFELPFISTSGIIDNDNVILPGSLPFFIVKGFTGTIPAGTPFIQIIPFKREDWKSELVFEDPKKMAANNYANSLKYRRTNGGVYQTDVWQRRKYE